MLLFFVFSPLENLSLFLLMFSLFKFKLDGDVYKKMFYSIIFLSLFSFLIGNSSFSPIGQLIIIIVCTWVFIEIPLFYSMVMATTSFILIGLIQILLIFSFQLMGVVTLEGVAATNEGYTPSGYMISSLTTFTAIAISMIANRFRIGFHLTPKNRTKREAGKKENIFVTSMLVFSICIPLLSQWGLNPSVGLYIVLFFLLTTCIGLFLIRKCKI